MKKTFLLIAVLLSIHSSLSTCSSQTTRSTSYARSNQEVTLDLNWTKDNYGTVQWQTSEDDGATWTDINNATASSYTFKTHKDALYRAHILGDPSCPPINIERQIKIVSFITNIARTSYNSADIEVSLTNMEDAEIVEYGYAENFSALGRTYDMLPLTKVGDNVPGEKFTMTCGSLRPNTSYSIRFYAKTADGGIIFGPGKLATTTAGIEFNSEDWTIEKTRLRAQFLISGTTTSVSDVNCYWGKDLDDMKSTNVTDLGSGKYRSANITGLTSGTTYYFKVTANVDGAAQEAVKEIKTMTDYSSYTVDETVTTQTHKIAWTYPRTLTRISDESINATEYPRMCRIDDNTLMLTYHGGTTSDQYMDSYYRLSYDNGATWDDQVKIFDKTKTFLGSGYWRICNPQATLLDNGWIILSATANGNPETNDNCKVICTVSKDKGKTWGDPVIVCRGRTWEPHILQLPGGELELLVSSEAQWYGTSSSVDQQIISCRSTDYGQTWTSSVRASYLAGGRDGMPVPILMQGNKGVMFTIESPNAGVSPSVVHRALDADWDTTAWDRTNDDDRWASGLNNGGGAPYCVQLPTGEIVMQCHTNQAGNVWQTSRPQVGIADNTGHNLKYKTLPVTTSNPLESNEGAYYNSLWVKDAEHIWLLVTRVTYNNTTRGQSTIEYIEGTIKDIE